MKKQPETPIKLTEAVKRAVARWPQLPVHALRDAVTRGEIPHSRSSTAKRARYFVLWSDIETYLARLQRS
jgi:hypothetical protein